MPRISICSSNTRRMICFSIATAPPRPLAACRNGTRTRVKCVARRHPPCRPDPSPPARILPPGSQIGRFQRMLGIAPRNHQERDPVHAGFRAGPDRMRRGIDHAQHSPAPSPSQQRKLREVPPSIHSRRFRSKCRWNAPSVSPSIAGRRLELCSVRPFLDFKRNIEPGLQLDRRD